MSILVTGGAGYVGSHTCKALAAAGLEPVTYDNLSTGHRWAVRWGPLVVGDLADRALLRKTIREHNVEAVVHFAASSLVGESVKDPAKYFRNNLVNTLSLLETMVETDVNRLVFSSTCAVYGAPLTETLDESHPRSPVNPYGESKLAIESACRWFGEAYGLRWLALRYFNAAGADPDGQIGEAHACETHLIPLTLEAVINPASKISIFGTDYPTPDGTAIRDYIHVADLADAHLLAMEKTAEADTGLSVNLGTGQGHSVREVISMVESVTGRPPRQVDAPRRPGDPAKLVAAAERARTYLGWTPQRSELRAIAETAWNWRQKQAHDAHRDAVAV